MASKKCIACDAVIGESETKCPACGVNIEELEQEVQVVERANKVIEKRRTPAPPVPPTPQPQPKKKSIFASLTGKD